MRNQPDLLLASPDSDIGLVPARKARQKAKQIADATGKSVTVRSPLTDAVVATAKPKRKPASKSKKPVKAKAKHANGKAIAHRGEPAEGKAAQVLKLASRPNGASRA
jgi:hypothetical protein